MPLSESPYLGSFCAFGSSVTWAIGSAGYSHLSKNYSTFAVNFARALIALPLFLVMGFWTAGSIALGINAFREVQFYHLAWFTLSMISSYGLGDSLFLWSARSLGVPAALAIASSYPLWTVLAGYLFGSESLVGLQILGIILTVMGVITVILAGSKQAGRLSWKGIVLAFLTSIAWATNGFAISRVGSTLTPAVGNTIRMILALFLSACFGRIILPKAKILLPQKVMFQYLWLFVLEAFGGSFFYLYGLSHSPLALGATLASLAPVLSVPVAWLMGWEKVALMKGVGVFLVVTGVFFLLLNFTS